MTARASLSGLLAAAGLPAELADQATFTGAADPLLRSPYRLAACAQAAIAASGLAAAEFLRLRGGALQQVAIDSLAAVASLRSYRYLRIDGKPPADNADPLTGFYQSADQRWVYLHCNFGNLKRVNLHVLECRDDRAEVGRAVRARAGLELEEALFDGGGCGALVRTEDEWNALPQSAAVASEPLIELVRIGDADPPPQVPANRPLGGIRCLDLTRVLAGPTSTKVLACQGADVLRIEREDLSDSGFFDLDTGLGKRAAFMDLRRPADLAAMDRLVAGCDVFVQAYRPGALAQRGLSTNQLAARRPGIVTVNLSAWGSLGPWRLRRGYDTVVQAANGLAWLDPDAPPRFMPVAAQDYLAGYLMAFGAMAALCRRQREGGSWQVNVSLAGVGHWLRAQGRLDETRWTNAPADLDEAALQTDLAHSSGVAGELTHLKPMPAMTLTPPRWNLSAPIKGLHAAQWL